MNDQHERLPAQLKAWQGPFGTSYTDRNVVEWRSVLPFFQKMVAGLSIARVLEVGCNRGHNLVALAALLGENAELIGVEPNRYAAEHARATSVTIGVLYGHAFELPFRDAYFDLVFTSGVLMHIDVTNLPVALAEIYRVSKRYILSIEYFSEREEAVHYRGESSLLWKRNVLAHWQQQFRNLTLVRAGYEADFDRSHWWILEKPSSSA